MGIADWRRAVASKLGEWELDRRASATGYGDSPRVRVFSDVGSNGDLMGVNLDGVATRWAND